MLVNGDNRKNFDEFAKAFNEHRVYHGTSRGSARNISKNGFSVKNKVAGATAAFNFPDQEANSFNYYTKNKFVAGNFANRAGQGEGDQEIVRVIIPPDTKTEIDPRAGRWHNNAIRSSKDIPPDLVLPKSNQSLTIQKVNGIAKSLNLGLRLETQSELEQLIKKMPESPREKASLYCCGQIDSLIEFGGVFAKSSRESWSKLTPVERNAWVDYGGPKLSDDSCVLL